MVRCRRSRLAFTLIELLVVIAIIAILIGLLSRPCRRSARPPPGRVPEQPQADGPGLPHVSGQQCTLPTGWLTPITSTGNPSPGWSWSALILPFIEQGNLYTTLNPTLTTANLSTGNLTAAQIAALQTPVKTYQCPGDTPATLNPDFQDFVGASGLSKSNYVVNKCLTGPTQNGPPANMTVQAIRDGSSNTVMVGERDMTLNVAACAFLRSATSSCSFEGRGGYAISPDPRTFRVPGNTGQGSVRHGRRRAFGL